MVYNTTYTGLLPRLTLNLQTTTKIPNVPNLIRNSDSAYTSVNDVVKNGSSVCSLLFAVGQCLGFAISVHFCAFGIEDEFGI